MLAPDDRESLRWRQNFIQTYLERDIPLFGPRIPAETLRRFWTMLAHRQGSLLNASDLARALEVSAQTVTRYLDLLCDLLLVRRVPPFVGNVGKRLVKSPRVYVRDSGLVHALLGLESLDDVLSHPVVGASWEGFVLENLLTFLPWRTEPSHYRSSGGAEIDLVLSFASGALWAIEVKRSPAAKPQRGFHEACEALGVQRRILVRSGEGRFPLGNGVESVGLADLCDELRRLA
jgi:predicted AAA+ superfamily ATPase